VKLNPLFCTDYYKTGHVRQFPPGTQYVYSNFTCRGDKNFKAAYGYDHKVVFFGLQGICRWLLQDLWNNGFFHKPKNLVLEDYQDMMDRSLGKGSVGTDHIAALHDLGYLPIRIKALPEGSRVNIRVPVYTIINTDPRFYWLTNYLETQMSAELWKPLTSATTAYEYRRMFAAYARMTGVDPSFIDFQGHDFSMRGMSGLNDATQSGAGHLLSFKGTDTITAIDYLRTYYDGYQTKYETRMPGIFHLDFNNFVGGSVPATEHAVVCMGQEGGEAETFRRLIQDVYPSGIISLVSDTWDFWAVVTGLMSDLKDMVLGRDGKVVIRPDSGDPVKIIVGDPEAPADSPARRGAVGCLWDIYGGETNSQGYKTLDPHVGLIYGDSISLERANKILAGLMEKGFSSANIIFGVGSYTYQFVTRDTFGTAIKATWGVVNGETRELCKTPKTDDGMKFSAKGLLRVEEENGNFVLYDQQTPEQEEQGALRTVFEDGNLMIIDSLFKIRQRLLV
jgi:nicotinamide phosphoribosyltransferase